MGQKCFTFTAETFSTLVSLCGWWLGLNTQSLVPSAETGEAQGPSSDHNGLCWCVLLSLHSVASCWAASDCNLCTVQLLGTTPPFSMKNIRDLSLMASCKASACVWVGAAPSARTKKSWKYVFMRAILTTPKMLSHPARESFLKQICSIYLFNVLLNDLLECYSCCTALKWMGRHNLREHAPYNHDESFE